MRYLERFCHAHTSLYLAPWAAQGVNKSKSIVNNAIQATLLGVKVQEKKQQLLISCSSIFIDLLKSKYHVHFILLFLTFLWEFFVSKYLFISFHSRVMYTISILSRFYNLTPFKQPKFKIKQHIGPLLYLKHTQTQSIHSIYW